MTATVPTTGGTRRAPDRRAARWVAAAVAPLAVLAAAAAPAAAAPIPVASAPAYASYVALGDDYAAGPLVPVPTGPPGCLRSSQDYPAKTDRALGVADFRDVSCSGATTDDLAGPQSVPLGTNPPQLDALGPRTALVSVTLGSNDIGFAGSSDAGLSSIITTCAVRSPTQPSGAACRDFYTAGGTDQVAARIAAATPRIAAALAAIRRRSPEAKVLLVGYPAIVPDTGPGCFPQVPLSPGDVAFVRGTEKRLNAMLAQQAGKAGVTYVDAYPTTIGHDVCTPPGVKWMGFSPTAPAFTVHPNELGMVAVAKAVVAAAR